jgi:hypothetical protein
MNLILPCMSSLYKYWISSVTLKIHGALGLIGVVTDDYLGEKEHGVDRRPLILERGGGY